MTDNPYQPPAAPKKQPKSGWARFWEFFTGVSTTPKALFLSGDPVIYNGIIFYVDPDNDSELFAACPTTDFSNDRLALIKSEVRIAYELFLAEIPGLSDALNHRTIKVHLIDSYRKYNEPTQQLKS